jgi:hypothetical protein
MLGRVQARNAQQSGHRNKKSIVVGVSVIGLLVDTRPPRTALRKA